MGLIYEKDGLRIRVSAKNVVTITEIDQKVTIRLDQSFGGLRLVVKENDVFNWNGQICFRNPSSRAREDAQ